MQANFPPMMSNFNIDKYSQENNHNLQWILNYQQSNA